MKLVCLGDSLTYGYGVPRRDCWVSLAAGATGHTLINRGLNGDTTGGMLARFGRDVLQEKPERVLLMGGANDLIFGGSDAPARANLAALVHQAAAAGIRPMVGLPPPMYADDIPQPWRAVTDWPALVSAFAAYRQWLISFSAAFGLKIVDFAVPGLLPPQGAAHYLDGLHPDKEGHRLMARALIAALPGGGAG